MILIQYIYDRKISMLNDIDRIYIMKERYQCLMILIMKERYQCLMILIQYIL